jgi:DNA-binding transcriptional ArsR family regulator
MRFQTLLHRARILSSVSRLRVLECVGDAVMCPGDIARTLELAPATIAYHLSALASAGLVRCTRQGRFRLYEATGVRWGVLSEEEIDALFAEEHSRCG